VVNLPRSGGGHGGAWTSVQALTLGLIENKVLTGDQVKKLCGRDNVVAPGAKGFADLGIDAHGDGCRAAGISVAYRPSGQYAAIKASAKNLRKV
jgi:hypothetical protein